MPSFLDLPREIRDEIYTLVLLSPTNLVEIHRPPRPSVFRKPALHPSALPSTALFKLCFVPDALPGPMATKYIVPVASRPKNTPAMIYTTLSLLRVNRQIYDETHMLFWDNTVFYFPCIDDMSVTYVYSDSENLGVLRTLKMMGQTASRLITSIRLGMGRLAHEYGTLARILNVLASRARYGQFQRLELCWDWAGFSDLEQVNKVAIPRSDVAMRYQHLLECLIKASSPTKESYDRVIYIDSSGRKLNKLDKTSREVVKDLHLAFGGRLFWGRKLAWDNYKLVYNGPLSPEQGGKALMNKKIRWPRHKSDESFEETPW